MLGHDPIDASIERIRQTFQSGEIDLDEALRLAVRSGATARAGSISALSTLAVDVARARWRDGLALGRIVLSATSATGESDTAVHERATVTLDFLAVASTVLTAIPDGRVLADAVAAATALIANAAPGPLLAQISYRLGLLYFEPHYFSGDYVNYDSHVNHWRKRFEAELGMTYAAVVANAPAMPAPKEALETAERHLRAALAVAESDAMVLRTLEECVRMQVLLYRQEDRIDDLRAIAARSLVAATAQSDPAVYIRTCVTASLVTDIDPAAVLQRIGEVFAAEPAAVIERLGPKDAIATVLAAIYALRRMGDPRGKAMVDAYRATVERVATERERCDFRRAELDFLTLPAPDGSSVPLMTIVERAQAKNQEANILEFLDTFAQTQPATAAAHAAALAYLRYLMEEGLAANAVSTGDWGEAIVHDAACLIYCFLARFEDGALTATARIEDLAGRPGGASAAKAAAVLLTCALWLERVLGERGMLSAQAICRRAFRGMMAGGNGDITSIVSLLQSAKNVSHTSALRAGVRYETSGDPGATPLLAAIAALDQRGANPPMSGLDEDTLLSSFMQAADREPGATDEQRLRNLQRAFERRADAVFAAPTNIAMLPHTDVDALRAGLDERTVLLDYYIGESPKGNVCTIVLLLTREDTQFTSIETDFPWFPIEMERGGQRAFMPPIALFVQAARRGVVTVDPGPRVVDPDVADALASNERALLGPFVEALDRYHAAGKDHLIVVPSGPLHVYPWHVLGGPNHLLADRWTVTWLPSSGFVALPQADPTSLRATTGAVAVGLAFETGDYLGLPRLKNSLDETRAVARTLGAAVLLDGDATKAAVVTALQTSRFVHISTHGLMNVAAPAFQSIVLAPDGGTDGRLFAHEIYGLDLRGLDVITLSACETALGRYDLGDNVRGLPAAFLVAGVRTIVGTLWNANDAATVVFFPAFYESLNAGSTPRDAFRRAQIATRAKFPKYWDWAAFFLMGHAT